MRKSRECELILIEDFSIGEILKALEEFVKRKPFFTIDIDMKGSGKYVYIPTHKQNRLDCLRLVFGLLVYNKDIDGMFDDERINPFDSWVSDVTDTKLRKHEVQISSAFRIVIADLDKDDLTCRIIDVLNKYFENSNRYYRLISTLTDGFPSFM
jgi:hypothetical protein